jgi:uncharacterized protein (TIGR03000 family)
MRKWLMVTILTLAGVVGSEKPASACWWGFGCGWWTCGYPAYCGYPYAGCGGSAGCYYYAPYYGWFGQWNYSHSPYAWPGGYTKGNYPAHLPADASRPPYTPIDRYAADRAPATIVATLPEDAELLFNGVPATGASGRSRSFQTDPLTPGRTYEYQLTARVMRDGKPELVTEKVTIRAGAETKVNLELRSTVAAK